MTNAQVFEDIYRRKVWGEGSGGGSGLEASAPYVQFANRIIEREKPTTILDVGCGDGQVASRLDLGGAFYVGIDPSATALSMARQRCPGLSFYLSDITCFDSVWFDLVAPERRIGVVATDLLLCKEATQHMGIYDLVAYINFAKRSKAVIHCSATQPGDTERVRGGYAPFRLAGHMRVEESHQWEWGTGGYVVEFARGGDQ